jgi:transcriptional regulator with XRE-family HTH domain
VTSKDNRADVRDFLASRRARLSPALAGFHSGGRRRVPGLRREEVATLAGVSTEWYTRLEKGHIAGVSDEVLISVARALQLDDEERTYLFHLARASRPTARECRHRWVAHDILLHNRGTKSFLHPDAGPIELAYHSLELPIADTAHLLTTYTAEPGSADEDKLKLLASWTAPGGVRRPDLP